MAETRAIPLVTGRAIKWGHYTIKGAPQGSPAIRLLLRYSRFLLKTVPLLLYSSQLMGPASHLYEYCVEGSRLYSTYLW